MTIPSRQRFGATGTSGAGVWKKFALLALCFPLFATLVSSSSSSSSASLPSATVIVAPVLVSTATARRSDDKQSSVGDENKPRNDLPGLCNNRNNTSSSSSSSVPVELGARGGQQEPETEAVEETDDGEDSEDAIDESCFEGHDETEEADVDDDDDDDDEEVSSILETQTKKRKRFLKKRKLKFLNRIAEVSNFLLKREDDAILDEQEPITKRGKPYSTGVDYDSSEEDDDRITPQSDLTRPGRYVHIVTTAALPWMTGTAVNPLLRAAYLHDRLKAINSNTKNNSNGNGNSTTPYDGFETSSSSNNTSYVTLVIPWLELPEDQRQVYNGRVFENKEEQELYVRTWLEESAGMPDAAANLKIVFYNARYHSDLGSVFAMGDIIQELPPHELDVCVLEEPEHLNWFRAPSMKSWTKQYNYVVGIVHTNYDQYATQHYSGMWTAPAIRLMSAAMVRAYCHKVIKLSAVVQDFAPEKEITSNVHGVREEFIAEGVVAPDETAEANSTTRVFNESSSSNQTSSEKTQVYFIGKLLWTKGLDILLQYEDYYKDIMGEYFAIDVYGSGPDQLEIVRAYLGRPSKSKPKKKKKLQTQIQKASKNTFVRAFTWMNRRRKPRKGKKSSSSSSKSNSNDDGEDGDTKSKSTITVEDIYNDVIEVMESLPLKAKESFDVFPTQLKESLDQLSEDVTKAQESVKGLPSKARRVVNQLIDELSARAATFPLPRSLYEFRRQPIPATFPGRVDHAALKGGGGDSSQQNYKIFVNPSVSEVLCTTTAEALAMGKFAIIPVHPSNEFFMKFPNCLSYRNPYEFVANLRWALTHDPVPHTPELAREFTWQAATDRFLEASRITHKEAREREILGRSKIDERIAWFHNEIGKGVKGDIIRKALGAGPVSGQVQYEMTKQRRTKGDDDGGVVDDNHDDDDDDDDHIIDDDDDDSMDDHDDDDVMGMDDMEHEGMPRKFRNSVFVKALREAIESSLTTTID